MIQVYCSVRPEFLAQVNAIALSRDENRGTTAAWLWRNGSYLIMQKQKGRLADPIIRGAIAHLPELGDEPSGPERLGFRVHPDDLRLFRLTAIDMRKEPAQLNRNALALGLYLWGIS